MYGKIVEVIVSEARKGEWEAQAFDYVGYVLARAAGGSAGAAWESLNDVIDANLDRIGY